MHRKQLIALLLLLGFACLMNTPRAAAQGAVDTTFVKATRSSLNHFSQAVDSLPAFHPVLGTRPPVAVSHQNQLYIFDTDSASTAYHFIRTVPPPFQLPEAIRASFPLASYGNRTTSIVTADIFNTRAGYATLLHEFVHCYQANTVESDLKNPLTVYQQAMKEKHYTWELDYDFPYSDSMFVALYSRWVQALAAGDVEAQRTSRRRLRAQLSKASYEYLVWEEWKEGFARYIENLARKQWGLPSHPAEPAAPYNRVSLYASGSLYIQSLIRTEPTLANHLDQLFARMYHYGED